MKEIIEQLNNEFHSALISGNYKLVSKNIEDGWLDMVVEMEGYEFAICFHYPGTVVYASLCVRGEKGSILHEPNTAEWAEYKQQRIAEIYGAK